MIQKLFFMAMLVAFACGQPIGIRAQSPVASYIPLDKPWGNPSTTVSLPVRHHPFLFISASEIAAAKNRADKEAWARRNLDQLLHDADSSLSSPLSIPDLPGAWAHYYVCKVCGIGLETSGTKNICPRCGREYSGWPYDAVVAGMRHEDNFAAAQTDALAYAFTGKKRYADRVRDTLSGYADRYETFPIHDYKNGHMQRGARITAQTLNEATIMIKAAWAYDLIYNYDGMTTETRNGIESRLLRPMAAIIRRNDWGVSNWQSWHNSAMAAAGFVLNDKGMVDHAVYGKSGFVFQMNHSVLPDGFWYEGTASYHFYALDALQWQAMAMRNAGMKESTMPQLEAMYRAPLDYVFPNGDFPSVNDSDPVSLKDLSNFYEMAFSWFHKSDYGSAAALGKRKSINALLWGTDKLPPPMIKTGRSRNFGGLGAVLLRQGNGPSQLVVHLDYGPHGGAHGHYDKLATIFFALGNDVAVDPGRLEYGASLHQEWYMTSLAHNTMTVDGKNQSATKGRLVSFQDGEKFAAATASCDTAYRDVLLTRTTVLTPAWYLDVFSGASKTSRQFDLAWHIRGDQKTSLSTVSQNEPLGFADGYQHLARIRRVVPQNKSGSIVVDYRQPRNTGTVRQWVVPIGDTPNPELYFADGVTDRDVTTCPMTLQRTRGFTARFITLLEPIAKGAMGDIKSVTADVAKQNASIGITVLTESKSTHLTIGKDGKVAGTSNSSSGSKTD